MKIKNSAIAGTLESSDITVQIEPNSEDKIVIELKSSVEKQFGEQIRQVILNALAELKVESAVIRANDKGALDCVIKSRVQTAVLRASGEVNFNWGGEN